MLTAAILATALLGQPQVNWENTPVMAAKAAAADIQSLPPDQATRTRYLWLRSGSRDELAVTSMIANSLLSRVNVGVTPGSSPGMVPLAGGKVVRLDLGLFATEGQDLKEILDAWEKFTLVEKDFTFKTILAKQKVSVPKYRAGNGKWYDYKIQDVTVRTAAPYVQADVAILLERTGSEVPIIDAREFQRTGMTTQEGGLYYEFRGLKKSTKLVDYLKSRGASQQQAEELESLEKLAILKSKVTGKERQVAIFRGAGVRPTVGGGIISITFDIFDRDRAENSPLRNLLHFVGRGSEVIVEMSNGFHEFTLFDANGNLVDSAPDQLVQDHTIPEPHNQILAPGISCVVCHAQESGWRTAPNDVKTILASGTNIFGDLTSKDDAIKQAQILAGMYTGPDWFEAGTGPLAVGRLTYSKAVLRATGQSAQDVATRIGQYRDTYQYADLTIWDIAREIGITGIPGSDGNDATQDDLQAALMTMKQLIGANPAPGQVLPEDPIISAALAGISITRRSYDTIAGVCMTRAYSRMSN